MHQCQTFEAGKFHLRPHSAQHGTRQLHYLLSQGDLLDEHLTSSLASLSARRVTLSGNHHPASREGLVPVLLYTHGTLFQLAHTPARTSPIAP